MILRGPAVVQLFIKVQIQPCSQVSYSKAKQCKEPETSYNSQPELKHRRSLASQCSARVNSTDRLFSYLFEIRVGQFNLSRTRGHLQTSKEPELKHWRLDEASVPTIHTGHSWTSCLGPRSHFEIAYRAKPVPNDPVAFDLKLMSGLRIQNQSLPTQWLMFCCSGPPLWYSLQSQIESKVTTVLFASNFARVSYVTTLRRFRVKLKMVHALPGFFRSH